MKELTGSPTASHIKSSSSSLQVQCLRWQSMFEDHDDGYDNIDDHEMDYLNDCKVQCLRWQSMFEDHDDGYDNIDDHEMNDLNDCNFYQQVQCLLWQSEY